MDKKKRLLIVINHMDVGGIQVALMNLLQKIVDDYDIDLLCISGSGALLKDIPEGIRVLPTPVVLQLSDMTVPEARARGWLYGVIRIACSLWAKVFSKKVPALLITRLVRCGVGDYDVAISYTQPTSSKRFFNLSNEVVLNSCNAQKRVSFVHCDFQQYGGNDRCNRALYRRFDVIAAVSESVGERLVEVIPEISSKVCTVRNCVDVNRILELSSQEPLVYEETYSVITVARLSEEKGLVRCVALFRKLREKGYDIKWHIVGGGPCEDILRREIMINSAEEYIVLHGSQSNPYRYMRNAQLFLLPSFHEAAPVVYTEAQILKLPILTTRTTSAIEMVEKTHSGYVCGIGDEELFIALERLCKDGISMKMDEQVSELEAVKQFASLIQSVRS